MINYDNLRKIRKFYEHGVSRGDLLPRQALESPLEGHELPGGRYLICPILG
jgi:hypothetical protein